MNPNGICVTYTRPILHNTQLYYTLKLSEPFDSDYFLMFPIFKNHLTSIPINVC